MEHGDGEKIEKGISVFKNEVKITLTSKIGQTLTEWVDIFF